ncbi:MAG: efflux RND transporter permease subunit [Gammaproteobacteria bacterium]|nr:efflux RND transporter permease subunit [Gammaproteobacteria bacterium]
MNDLATQVRHAFYGVEAQRIQRGTDDVRVMVRYPEQERRSLANLEEMRIRTPQGDEVPFLSVAETTYGSGYSAIRRQDRQRIVNVTGDVDRSIVTPEEVMSAIGRTVCSKGTELGHGIAPAAIRPSLASPIRSVVSRSNARGRWAVFSVPFRWRSCASTHCSRYRSSRTCNPWSS